MLCRHCEALFSQYESEFARNIFYPYVQTELDSWGRQTGKIKSFPYSEWLLKFIISVQFRFCSQECDDAVEVFGEKRARILKGQLAIWREYLLNKRADSGNNRSYIVFLQNLAFGHGSLPKQISEKVNFYLLRSVDSTLLFDDRILGVYVKLGPLLILTSIIPTIFPEMNNIVIRKNGDLSTIQNLKNARMNNYVFIDRPREAMEKMVMSKTQKDRISKAYAMNKDKQEQSLAMRAALSDKILKLTQDTDADMTMD